MQRSDAWALLTDWTKADHLLKHSLAVEAAMRAYARKLGADEDLWGLTGLLHDFDYERHPSLEDHPLKGEPVLRAHGVPEEAIYAIQAHGLHAAAPPKIGALDQALYAVDELTGFITAVALVRPTRSILEVEVSSVKKKMKDKAFARAVHREDIVEGAALMGVSLDEHIGTVLVAMQEIAPGLGLAGS